MVSELLQKYIWLVQTFIRAGRKGLTLSDIASRWERRFGYDYSRRTFNNHRAAIEEVFGVRIECDRSTNCYFIDSADDISDENAESAWLINTFTVNNVLALSRERLPGRVSVEDIPSGHRHLTALMEAMVACNEVKMEYRKYTSSVDEMLTVHPYAVKEYAKRWYLIGFCVERDGMRVYGLDRIQSLETGEGTFSMPEGFDVDELFATSFGIYLPEGKAKYVTFSVSETEARFLRDLPVHRSQEEVGKEDEKVIFRIFACPDRNMIMEFCKYGSSLEVLAPEVLRLAVAEELKAAAGVYERR